RTARGGHGAGRQRLFDPGADEAHFVVEANAVLLLEAADARLDLLFLRVELLLELFFCEFRTDVRAFFRARPCAARIAECVARSFSRARPFSIRKGASVFQASARAVAGLGAASWG